jgi:hypothetical protein
VGSAGGSARVDITGGQLLGFFFIPNGTRDQFLAQNPNNDRTGTPIALLSFDAANPDRLEHFRFVAPEKVSQVEPIPGRPVQIHVVQALDAGPDAYDDVYFTMTTEGGDFTAPGFTSPNLMGRPTYLDPGARPVTRDHVLGVISYAGYGNPPTYGPHHPQPLNPGIYDTQQDDADLVHNLEHGHIWISYNPSLLGTSLAALQDLVRSFGDPASAGILLTPRAGNDTAIALASWGRLLTLDSFQPDTIRRFILTNRGSAPEGFLL